jgi:GNAT superfamily N-acetyltransferase
MRLRQATKDDIAQIASLHALSWRDAYRSILGPVFLAGPVESDRMAVWNARLSNPRDDQQVAVAVEQGVLVGFVCVFGDDDPKWGARVDNLHVTPSARGCGIGAMLLRSAASWVADRYPGSALHLWVFEMNALACQFYARLGGSVVEKSVTKIASACGASILRFHWASATELLR